MALGGIFVGDGTSCLDVFCPQPIGACCFSTGFCLELTESECTQVGATWGGIDSNCDDVNENGIADTCEAGGNPADVDGDGFVNGTDLALLLSAWGTDNENADVDGNGVVNGGDLSFVLSRWTG